MGVDIVFMFMMAITCRADTNFGVTFADTRCPRGMYWHPYSLLFLSGHVTIPWAYFQCVTTPYSYSGKSQS